MKERSLQEILDEYFSLGIKEQIDWEKFYLYSIITHSTAIEGSTVTEVEAQLLFDEGITSSKRTMTEQMMNLDLKNAYDYGIEWIKQHPQITVDSLINLSSKVMARTGSEYHTISGDFSAAKGELRKVNVKAGIGGASYMPYQKVPAKLEAFCEELNQRRKDIDSSDIIAVYNLSFWANYELVTIHPWADGNGRMSRLLMNLLQWEFNLIPSKVLKEDKAEYIQALVDSREKEDVHIFESVMMALHTKHLQKEIEEFNDSMKKYGDNEKTSVQNINSFGVNEKTSVQIIEIMKNTPNITLQEIAKKLNRSKRAVEMQVKKIREQGIIKRVGADKNGHWEVNYK